MKETGSYPGCLGKIVEEGEPSAGRKLLFAPSELGCLPVRCTHNMQGKGHTDKEVLFNPDHQDAPDSEVG